MTEPKHLPMSLRGDGPCSRCGTLDNPVWSTSSVLWNEVVRSEPLPWMADTDIPDGDGLMCVNCFIRLVRERGYRVRGWTLTPDWNWDRLDAGEDRRG